jgi:phosphate:Na+ symporter
VSPTIAEALGEMEGAAAELRVRHKDHRTACLAAVAPGQLTAADAFARIEAAGRLDRIAQQAWRTAAHLLGRGAAGDGRE